MSETVGLGTLIGGDVMIAMPDSVGPANAGVEVEIRDADGNVAREDEVGEIHMRTASVFIGYWDDPDATAAALDAHRWYRTGDFGRIANGFLYLESRMRDMILRGGENIYPLEIEHRLVEHPDIDDAAVIGVDHPELGQEVKAFVVCRDGTEVTAAEVRAWVAEALAPFKVPAHVELRATLPYTETGKLLKHELEREERERAGG
jgi:acyl-CoA synthetase (AMP-forming)/AMP-acid ligase II